MSNTRYRIVKTKDGFVGLVATPQGLRRVIQLAPREAMIRSEIAGEFPYAIEDRRLLPDLAVAVRRYLGGRRVDFDVRFDLTDHREFDIDVWTACQRVPYGQTRSYKSLAERIGRPGAARAVGSAMGRNPCPIVVPCHRVVKSDGSLGGYSGRGGLDLKRRLLDLEAGG